MKKTTVLLVDDHVIVREGIHGLLALETDIEIVGEAMDGRQAVGMVMDHTLDCDRHAPLAAAG